MDLMYKNNATTDFIKQLLATTPLPCFKTVQLNDYVVADTNYIFKNNVIKIPPGKSGPLGYNSVYLFQGALLPSQDLVDVDNIYLERVDSETGAIIREELHPNSYTDAKYYRSSIRPDVVMSYNWGDKITNITHTFSSNVTYYDSETHKYLGKYLRCLRDLRKLDLMSMYNCYAGEVSYDLVIDNVSGKVVTRESSPGTTKMYLVPAQFNREYTIGFDCLQRFKVVPVLLSDGKLVTEQGAGNISIDLDLTVPPVIFPSCQMRHPVKVTIPCNHPLHQMYEKYLYLAVEVPYSNMNSFVVLEGDYTNFAPSITNIQATSDTSLRLNVNPWLLSKNDFTNHAISDKLLPYLVKYVIDATEEITQNVSRLKTYLPGISLSALKDGVWNAQLQQYLYQRYHQVTQDRVLPDTDILGYVDKEIETALRAGWMKPLERENYDG